MTYIDFLDDYALNVCNQHQKSIINYMIFDQVEHHSIILQSN